MLDANKAIVGKKLRNLFHAEINARKIREIVDDHRQIHGTDNIEIVFPDLIKSELIIAEIAV